MAVTAIGTGSGFKQGRDFATWLGLVPKQERITASVTRNAHAAAAAAGSSR